MDDRRTFLALATALVPSSLSTLSAQAQSVAPAASAPSGELARYTLTGPLADFYLLLLELRPRVSDADRRRLVSACERDGPGSA